jgi:hypothetical protein
MKEGLVMKSFEATVSKKRTVVVNGKEVDIPQWSGCWDDLTDDMTVIIGIIKEMGYAPRLFLEVLLETIKEDGIE